MDGGCRGTFLGAPWGPFSDVKKVWAEFFASKPYTSLALGIAGDLLLAYFHQYQMPCCTLLINKQQLLVMPHKIC